ncbi:MAG: hypothetical protein GX435_07475 [Exilispira sp.]|nr:hypothetical protein [Exilispira sp.]
MKRSIIFLMALIVLCSMPVLAKPIPVFDIIQISLNMDEQFLGLNQGSDGDLTNLEQVSDEQLANVEGDRVVFEDAVPTLGGTTHPDSWDPEWHDIIVVYGSNGYAIIDWNGWVVTDINHDGNITAEDLTIILVENDIDFISAACYSAAAFHMLDYQDLLDQQAYIMASK